MGSPLNEAILRWGAAKQAKQAGQAGGQDLSQIASLLKIAEVIQKLKGMPLEQEKTVADIAKAQADVGVAQSTMGKAAEDVADSRELDMTRRIAGPLMERGRNRIMRANSEAGGKSPEALAALGQLEGQENRLGLRDKGAPSDLTGNLDVRKMEDQEQDTEISRMNARTNRMNAEKPEDPMKGGSFQRIYDGLNFVGFFNPKTGQLVRAGQIPGVSGGGEGIRPNPMPGGEANRQGVLRSMLKDAELLGTLAGRNKGSIGFIEGKYAAGKRATVGVSNDVNDLFHISDNLSDMLLRARSGAQINEKEYARLRALVPNPRGPEAKFFSDLAAFQRETQQLLDLTTPGGMGGAPQPAQPSQPSTAPPAGGGDPLYDSILKDLTGGR